MKIGKAFGTYRKKLPHLFVYIDPWAVLIFLGGLSIVLFAATTVNPKKEHKLTLVAGNKTGESYIFSKALEKVVEEHHPEIKIDVKETGGTSKNIEMLEQGQAQLATAQADVPAGSSARIVSVLYQDAFQLVVRPKSNISQFVDLKGKRIGLPTTGGQYRSFLKIAEHYGLRAQDFQFIGENDQEADQAFRLNQVSAVFRVRALGNKSISELVQQYQGRLLPIAQVEAMTIKYPAFEPATIPIGAYKGNPPVPANNLATVVIPRTLLASEEVDNRIIHKITAILDEHRQELAKVLPTVYKPLVVSVSRPSTQGGTGVPIHLGALAFYEREQPSYVQENADFLALILTVALLIASGVRQLKVWIEQSKKDTADELISSAIKLMNVQDKDLEQKQQELDKLFGKAASDLVEEKISQESFRTFNEAYKTVREVIEHQRIIAIGQGLRPENKQIDNAKDLRKSLAMSESLLNNREGR
ncbi:MAG: TAXI family TRAP transporter solute-binding subunit [Symploca sp. SIO1C2]|nr:TAXI family TRAP transporter solute-binding subunit [Symploca sp. SIO1C2]